MVRKSLNLIVLGCIVFSTFSQKMNVLSKELEGMNPEAQIDKLNETFRNIGCADSLAGVELYEEIQTRLKEHHYPKGEVTLMGYLAYFNYCTGQMDEALRLFKKSGEMAKSNEIFDEYAGALKNTGNVYIVLGQYDSSLYYLNKGIDVSKTYQDSTYLGGLFIGKGIVLQNVGKIKEATESYLKAERLSHLLDDLNSEISARLNRYTVLYDHFPSRLNLTDMMETLDICRKNDLRQNEATVLQFIGKAELDSGKYESAVKYYLDGKNLSEQIGRIDLKLYHLEGLAHCQHKIKDYNQALSNIEDALSISVGYSFAPNSIQLYQLKAEILFEQKEYKKAINAAKSSIDLGNSTDQKEVTYRAYEILAKAYFAKGSQTEAFDALEKYINLSKEILDEEKSNQLQELQVKYETEKVRAEKTEAESMTSIAQAESERNKLLLIGALVVAVSIVTSVLFYSSKQKQKRKAELAIVELESSQKQLALEKQYQDSELKALKAQMNPHFIFNVLNSIQEYIVLNNKALASDYLSMFSHLIRSYLDQSGKKSISLQEESETLDRYLQLEALRFGEDFSMRLEIDEALDKEIIKIPPMIIQPYVENGIKHGLFNKKGTKLLEILIEKKNENILRCVIQDNGIGRQAAAKIKASKPSMHESFALGATQSRIELYNQQSTIQITIEVTDLYDKENRAVGTKVDLLIPIQS